MTLDIPVTFGGVSFGATTARISASISRDIMSLSKADESLCERRLIGRIVLGHAEDAPGQTKLIDCDHVIEGAFDVKQFATKRKNFTTGLTFAGEEIDRGILADFANASGRLMVDEILAEIPKPEKSSDYDDEDDDDGPSLFVADDAEWKLVNLDQLFDPKKATRKCLHEAGLETLGDLVAWQEEKLLSDIKGIGPSKIEEIEYQTTKFWEDNPDLSRE